MGCSLAVPSAFAMAQPVHPSYAICVELGAHTGRESMPVAPHAPRSAMEGLLVHLLLWGQERGYAEFSLGMAPLSGFERSPVASLWQRAGGFVYRHGEGLYGFQGLRAFKEKFEPRWEPRYLVYRGGFGLPRVLADVSALVAGGYRHVFLK